MPMKIPGIIVCSRQNSSRIKKKPFRQIAGKPILMHLLDRLRKSKIGLCLAIPPDELDDYQAVVGDHVAKKINYFLGHAEDPLARMHNASMQYVLDPVIRVNHDKIFVEPHLIEKALEIYREKKLEYLYSSYLVDGAGFEIISRNLLRKAFAEFGDHNVEHISYAVKALNPISHDFKEFEPIYRGNSKMRFLIDYEEDIDFMKIVFQHCGKEPTLREAIKCVGSNMNFTKINKLPKLTVYTCAYNAEKFISQSMLSVCSQTAYPDSEYIVIDDCSTDETLHRILDFSDDKRILIKRNDFNVGLSSSSNVALDSARGKYIIRLDADDVFIFPDSVEQMITNIEERNKDAIYPSYLDERSRALSHGRNSHHIGGSLFRTSAIRHVKFTERLRGYEGLDFFARAKRQIKIGYFDKPMFYYRDTPGSLSNENLEEREKIKKKIKKGITGKGLVSV
jgi:spore coat polysaccharide biosynthesis protein SpsF (cytidylyltransferase family)